MSGIAGTNVDFQFPWDPALQAVQDYTKEAGFRGNLKAGHAWGGFRTVQIPTANVLTLHSVPVQLVPAPGAGLLIVPTLMIASMVYNSTTYVANAGGASLIYGPAGAGTSTGFTLTQGFLQTASGTGLEVVNQSSSANYTPATTDVNQPLTLIAASADPTTGNSDLYVRVYFKIVQVPFTNPSAP